MPSRQLSQRFRGHRVVSPRTSLAWHRRLVKQKWSQPSSPGRPPVCDELRDLVIRLGTDNPRRFRRVHGELRRLGYKVGAATVLPQPSAGRCLPAFCEPPASAPDDSDRRCDVSGPLSSEPGPAVFSPPLLSHRHRRAAAAVRPVRQGDPHSQRRSGLAPCTSSASGPIPQLSGPLNRPGSCCGRLVTVPPTSPT